MLRLAADMPRRKRERRIDRVEYARMLLAIHGFISEEENQRCRQRITKAALKQNLIRQRVR